MSALDTLRTLARGERPATGLLHNCRFEGLGIEAYGIVIETSSHMAVFNGDHALFADVFNDNIGRLWVLGTDGFGGEEPIFSVPFDPDLDQGGGDVFFTVADHPDLAANAAPHVEAAGHAIVAETDGPRTRAFAIRAFGSADEGAVLFAVFRLRLDQEDVAGFHLMAARWDAEGHHIVRDFGSEATLAASRWSPRIGVDRGA
jgi:hypothetical protein